MQAYFLTKASGQWRCYLPCKTAGEVLLKAGLTSDYHPDDETSLQFWDDIYEKGVKFGLIRPEHLFVVWSKEEQSLINAAEALLVTEQLSVMEYRGLMFSVYEALNIFTRHLIQFTFEGDENHFKRVSNDQPEGETFFDNIYRWSYPHLDEDVPHWHTYTTAETDVRNGIEDAVKYKVQTKLPLTNYDRSVLDLLIDDNMVFDIDNLKGFLNDTSSFGFIAKENNKIIGFAYCYTLLRPDGKTMFYLHSIGMLPNYQDKGYGSKLLSFIKEYSKEIGCSEMFLITDKGNPRACHVYEKLGGKNDYKDEIVYVYDYEKGDK